MIFLKIKNYLLTSQDLNKISEAAVVTKRYVYYLISEGRETQENKTNKEMRVYIVAEELSQLNKKIVKSLSKYPLKK